MPIESFSSPQSNNEDNKIKSVGRKFVISSAHGKGSLTEGSENYGQTQKTTVYTGGESGAVEGSKVKKVEFYNNQTEDRTRETTYENSGRVVTRYNDRVEVKMPDGSVKVYKAKSPEISSETASSSTEILNQTESITNTFSIRPETKSEVESNTIEKESHLNKAVEKIKVFTEASKSGEFNSSEKIKPISKEVSDQMLMGSLRSEFTPEEYGKIINRIDQILLRLEYISNDSEEASSLISEIDSQIKVLNESGITLTHQKDIIDSKLIKLPAQKAESESIGKSILENKERINQLNEQRELLIQSINKNRTEMSELKSLGVDSNLKANIVREFMNKVSSEALKSIPAYRDADKFASFSPNNPEVGRATVEVARELISREFKDQLDAEVSQINPSLPSSSVSRQFGPEAVNYRRSYMSSNQTYALNLIRTNPEARALFNNDQLIDQECLSTRDAIYKRILNNEYTSPRETESAYLAADSFKNMDDTSLLFSVVRLLDSQALYRGYNDGIYFNVDLWNKISEEQKAKLTAFYGLEDLDFISKFASSERTPEQKSKFDSIIANFKDKLRSSL